MLKIIDGPKTFERPAKHSQYRHDIHRFSEQLFPTAESNPDATDLASKILSEETGSTSIIGTCIDRLSQGVIFLLNLHR